MSKTKVNDLWVEKYRPTSIKDVLMPNEFKAFFTNIIESGDVPNLLLTSSLPGTGKTSTLKALASDLNADFKFIKASQDNGINVLRGQIDDFAKTKSLFGKKGLKIIGLDEADHLTPALQAGLRSAIEDYSGNCRFIFTCNYKHKIIEPLRSRLQAFDYCMSSTAHLSEMLPKLKKRLIGILKIEAVPFVDGVLDELIKAHFPDIRTIYNTCHQFAKMHGCVDDRIMSFASFDGQILEYILNGNIREARTFIVENGYDYDSLYRFLFDSLVPRLSDGMKKGTAILTINKYMTESSYSIDKEITFTACMIELSNLAD